MAFSYRDRGEAAKGGAAAGLIGGIIISIYMLVMNIVQGQDIWMGMKGAAFPFIGARALQAGFDAGPVLAGIACHLAVSIIWGLIFGIIVYGVSRSGTVLLGIPFGIVVWLGM